MRGLRARLLGPRRLSLLTGGGAPSPCSLHVGQHRVWVNECASGEVKQTLALAVLSVAKESAQDVCSLQGWQDTSCRDTSCAALRAGSSLSSRLLCTSGGGWLSFWRCPSQLPFMSPETTLLRELPRELLTRDPPSFAE